MLGGAFVESTTNDSPTLDAAIAPLTLLVGERDGELTLSPKGLLMFFNPGVRLGVLNPSGMIAYIPTVILVYTASKRVDMASNHQSRRYSDTFAAMLRSG